MEYRSNLAAKNNLFKGVPATLKQDWSLFETRIKAIEVLVRMNLRFGDGAVATSLIYRQDGFVETIRLYCSEYMQVTLSMSEFQEFEDIVKQDEIPYCIFYEDKPNCYKVLGA